MWNRSGVYPEACDTLQRIAIADDPQARVWRGSGLVEVQQGIRVVWAFEVPPELVSQLFGPVGPTHFT